MDSITFSELMSSFCAFVAKLSLGKRNSMLPSYNDRQRGKELGGRRAEIRRDVKEDEATKNESR